MTLFRRAIVLSISAVVALACLPGVAGAQDVYMSIEKGFGEKIVVALPLFVGDGGLIDAPQIRNVLKFDLETSGHFSVIDNLEFIDETETDDRRAGRIDFPEWIALGGELLVKRSLSSVH